MKRLKQLGATTSIFILLSTVAVLTIADQAASQVRRLKGQTVYVPAYSHIYHGDRESPFYLTVTLSIRNPDPKHPLSLVSVDYFDTEGNRLKSYVEKELKIQALASTHYVVKESERSGGAGASFLVRWKAETGVVEPLIEAVMISTATQQGISFTSRGRAIQEEP